MHETGPRPPNALRHQTMAAKSISQTFLRRTTAPAKIIRPAYFSTTNIRHGILSKDRDDPLDPSKENTDTIGQAKDSRGSTPAQQQANVIKQQGPGQTEPHGSKTSGQSDSETEPSGLGRKKKGEKPGEEAVNPAVPKQ